MQTWTRTQTRQKFLSLIKWARLYGGALLIPLIENQPNMEEPLDYDSIMPDSYKGAFVVDRWSGVSPSIELEEDITDPEFGQPKYYLVSSDTLKKTMRIHHSRVIKMIGRQLPYWEEVAENYWGASELEHVYTELKKRDDTSANISFLIFLANIRVFAMEGLGQAITLGDQEALNRVYSTMQNMNRLMCSTGTFAIDKEDTFTEHQYSFNGINEIYESFMLDISGASEIPVDKLFGRSPTGFNSGEETLQNYYDTIQEKQESDIRYPLEKLMKIITMSSVGKIPDDVEISFNPVRRPSSMEKSDLAEKTSTAILNVFSAGIVGKGTVLRELKQQSSITGIWTNITDQMIEEADEEDEEAKKEMEEQKELMGNKVNELTGGNNNAEEMESKEGPEEGPENN